MAKAEDSYNWEGFAKKGKMDSEIKSSLSNLLSEFHNRDSKEVFQKDSQKFTNAFQEELNAKLMDILKSYSHLTQKEINHWKTQFSKEAEKDLDLHLNKKALGQISFDSFIFNKFIEGVQSIIDEIVLQIQEDEIIIDIMDPARIALLKIVLKSNDFKFYSEGKFALNVSDLKKVINCKAGDKSTTTLTIGKERLFVTITSEKYNSEIHWVLEPLDLDHQAIPFEYLQKIQYPFEFSIESQKFNYTLENLGVYSEITEIIVNEDRVGFKESGQIGQGEVVWKKNQLIGLNVRLGILEKEIIDNTISEKDREQAEKILESREGYSIHSLPFIKWIGKVSNILDPKDTIKFQIKKEHPFRVDIQFKKLGDSYLLYFLAPRVEEAKYEEDEELEDF